MRALPLALLILLAGCQPSSKAAPVVAGVPTPENWPLHEITLPLGATVEEFKPPAGAPTKDVESYTVFFAYTENADEVMKHVEDQAIKAGMTQTERQEIDHGGAQDSRRIDWTSKDAKWTVSIRYWKVNGEYPFQLIITPHEEEPVTPDQPPVKKD
jgi:hypothetical protein